MNPLDLHAVPDASASEERAFDDRLVEIGRIDGHALHAASGDLLDGLLDPVRDILNVPAGSDLFTPPADRAAWDELDSYDRAMWETLATAVRGIAACYLDEDRAREIAAQAA